MRAGILARLAGAGLLASAGLTTAAPAGGPALVAVARIEPGQWQLKTLGSDAAPTSLCIGDADVLIQYGHANAACQRFVVANEPDLATVRYTCTGTGHGQTTLKVATVRNFHARNAGDFQRCAVRGAI